MPAPPPPPPPPPPPATGGPPPPPPPPDSLPARPGKSEVKDRSALLQDITKGTKLRKTVTNDRSAPMIERQGKSSGPAIGGAPPVPGMPKPPGGLAPPVPGGNRLRSNSEGRSVGNDSSSSVPSAPQLGGLFAGGIPKLRSRGGVDTGANRDAAYLSDSEATRPDPPAASAPKPPTARPPPVPPSSTESPSAPPVNLFVANLRKPPPKPASRPSSTVSTSTKTAPQVPPRAPPPVPGVTKAPPPPPVRKPSAPAPPPPPSSASPAPPSAPPPPSSSAPKPPASGPPPPPPPASAPQPPNGAQAAAAAAAAASIAVQAARNAFGNSHAPSAPPPPPPTSSAPSAPAAPPPPPPPTSAPSAPSAPPAPPAPPPPRPSAGADHQAKSGRLDPSAYTLTNGGSSPSASPRTSGIIRIEDNRFKFQDESLFPKPRPFSGGVRMYRAGRGSSVPLDLSSLG